jgi:hypothetical protein
MELFILIPSTSTFWIRPHIDPTFVATDALFHLIAGGELDGMLAATPVEF